MKKNTRSDKPFTLKSITVFFLNSTPLSGNRFITWLANWVNYVSSGIPMTVIVYIQVPITVPEDAGLGDTIIIPVPGYRIINESEHVVF
jgi:hypothetical protein